MEALNTQKDGDTCSANCSCHSHSSAYTVSTGSRTTTTVLSARNNSGTVGREGAKKKQPSSYGGKLRAVYDCDKENESATTMTRKAASEPGSVGGGWQRGPPVAGSSCSAPFKDRTNNRATDGNRGDHSDGQKSSGSISTTAVDKPKAKMLIELAPPLNAARLKPIHQQTRTAKVS